MQKIKSSNTKPKKKVKINKSGSAVQEPDLSMYFSEIREKAFDIFISRQTENIEGNDLSDWLQAEEQIRGKYTNV